MKRYILSIVILNFVLLICSSLFASNRPRIIDRGVYEIPANREWKEHYTEAGQNDYLGTDFIGEYDSKDKIVIGYIISDKGSSCPTSDHAYGSADNYKDACYQYVQLSYRVIEDIGVIRIDRVCVNPTSEGKTLPSLIGNKIKWVLMQIE